MMLRILLIVMLFVAVGLGGCKKKEPTIGEKMDQMKEEAEKTADDMQDEAEDMADEAEDMADEAQKEM
ncbi:MAG: hypothetical protein ISS71_09745 [Phycisphaerae bacterium]|nr:hypothetical protein [Phycisphaerae bacterium]